MNWLFWSLLSAVFAGATAILVKVGVASVNSNLATAIRTSVVWVFVWGVVLATHGSSAVFELSRRAWLFLVLSGVATGLSWLCYFRAIQMGDVSRVAPVDKLSVVFVMVFAALFLRESLALKDWLGGCLIVLGAVVLAWH